MAYTPTTWASGDTITATKLNKMESGIVNAEARIFYVNVVATTVDSYTTVETLDKTFAEIYEASLSGAFVVLRYVTEIENNDKTIDTVPVYELVYAPSHNLYMVSTRLPSFSMDYTTPTYNGYPSITSDTRPTV